MKPRINLIRCKSLLNKSGIDGVDYAINPYVGCLHGCVYCYAKFMKRYTGHTESWGTFVDIKINAAEVLKKQIRKADGHQLMIGTVTDPYQPVERRYRLTQEILKILAAADCQLHIQSKSSLIIRDKEQLQKFPDIELCWTITTPDEADRRLIEPGAAPVSERLQAMKLFSQARIPTSAFLGPLFPFLTEPRIIELLNKVYESGVGKIYWDRFNYPEMSAPLMRKVLRMRYPSFARNLTASYNNFYLKVGQTVEDFCNKKGLEYIGCGE